MANVIRKENENFDSLLRRFKKKVNDEKVLGEYRKHEAFMKPSEKRRLEAKESRKRVRRYIAKENSFNNHDV